MHFFRKNFTYHSGLIETAQINLYYMVFNRRKFINGLITLTAGAYLPLIPTSIAADMDTTRTLNRPKLFIFDVNETQLK